MLSRYLLLVCLLAACVAMMVMLILDNALQSGVGSQAMPIFVR